VIGVGRFLEIGQVASGTLCAEPSEFAPNMAARTRRRRMLPGERETRG
jgi:hypothetical protein